MTVTDTAAELARSREPYVQATVVRAQKPTSAHAGDTALVRADGRIDGFVGGTCAGKRKKPDCDFGLYAPPCWTKMVPPSPRVPGSKMAATPSLCRNSSRLTANRAVPRL